MRILVVGGTNFIGPLVVRNLTEEGHEVTVYHRGRTELPMLSKVRHIRSNEATMPVIRFTEEARQYKPEVVVHMIPMGQADARAAVEAFSGIAERIVGISSGDVYRAYGLFQRSETGSIQMMPLTEESQLRTALYPYRSSASPGEMKYDYDKILVERGILGSQTIKGTILRLPKVYGPATGHGLEHYYHFVRRPQWRWTHGFVENVAHAISLAATHPAAAGKVFNVGEWITPTVKQRLASLPPMTKQNPEPENLNFDQDIVFDTSQIREMLGFREVVPYEEGIARTLVE